MVLRIEYSTVRLGTFVVYITMPAVSCHGHVTSFNREEHSSGWSQGRTRHYQLLVLDTKNIRTYHTLPLQAAREARRLTKLAEVKVHLVFLPKNGVELNAIHACAS